MGNSCGKGPIRPEISEPKMIPAHPLYRTAGNCRRETVTVGAQTEMSMMEEKPVQAQPSDETAQRIAKA